MKANNCYAFEPGILKREGGDSRVSEELSPTLRAVMGDNQVAVVYEMTHADEVIRSHGGGICPTLQHRMGTGGNQVPMIIEAVSMGHDERSAHFNEGTTDPLTRSDYKQPPIVCYAVDMGGGKSVCQVTEELSPTLTTTHYGEPVVCYAVDVRNGVINDRVNGTLQAKPNGGISYNLNNVCLFVYNISALSSNCMLSDNPNSGIQDITNGTARTLDLNGGNPACNQGGVMIIEKQNHRT